MCYVGRWGVALALGSFFMLNSRGSELVKVEWTRSLLGSNYSRYIGWPTAYRTSKGEILVVFSGDREGHVCPYGKVQMIRSEDNGETWSGAKTVCDGLIDDRDAGVIELKNGDLVLFWFTSLAFTENTYKAYSDKHPEYLEIGRRIPDDQKRGALGSWARRSSDGGRTWSEPVRVPVMTPHGGKQLADGRILVVGVRDRQTEGMLEGDPNLPTRTLQVAESVDDGRSFRAIGRIPLNGVKMHWSICEPTFYESQDGTLTALIRYEMSKDGLYDSKKKYPRYMLRSTSRDGGKTWSEVEFSNLDGFPPHVMRLSDGRLLCSYASRTVGRLGIYASISSDDGKTWAAEHEMQIAKCTSDDIGYPSTVENPDGTLLTVYYDHLESGKPAKLVGTKWRLNHGIGRSKVDNADFESVKEVK